MHRVRKLAIIKWARKGIEHGEGSDQASCELPLLLLLLLPPFVAAAAARSRCSEALAAATCCRHLLPPLVAAACCCRLLGLTPPAQRAGACTRETTVSQQAAEPDYLPVFGAELVVRGARTSSGTAVSPLLLELEVANTEQ